MNELSAEKDYNWYTIEDLASLSGYDLSTLKHGELNLSAIMDKMSVNMEVNTHLGGYHNTQKFYSENVLKALKQYQLRNSAPNALQDKETAIKGNVSFIEQTTIKQTISNLLDNPDTLQMLLTESLERNKLLGIENKQLKDVIAEQKPKVEFYDSVTNSKDTVSMNDAAKILGLPYGNVTLFKKLRSKGILDKNNIPYQRFMNSGYFKVIETEFKDQYGNSHVRRTTKVFQKGLDYIRKVVGA